MGERVHSLNETFESGLTVNWNWKRWVDPDVFTFSPTETVDNVYFMLQKEVRLRLTVRDKILPDVDKISSQT